MSKKALSCCIGDCSGPTRTAKPESSWKEPHKRLNRTTYQAGHTRDRPVQMQMPRCKQRNRLLKPPLSSFPPVHSPQTKTRKTFFSTKSYSYQGKRVWSCRQRRPCLSISPAGGNGLGHRSRLLSLSSSLLSQKILHVSPFPSASSSAPGIELGWERPRRFPTFPNPLPRSHQTRGADWFLVFIA
jgi:hypothetical protein